MFVCMQCNQIRYQMDEPIENICSDCMEQLDKAMMDFAAHTTPGGTWIFDNDDEDEGRW